MTDTKPPCIIYTAADLAWPRRWLPPISLVCLSIFLGTLSMGPHPGKAIELIGFLAGIAAVAAGYFGWLAHCSMTTEEEYVRAQVNAALAVELAAARKVALNARLTAAIAAQLASARKAAGLPAPDNAAAAAEDDAAAQNAPAPQVSAAEADAE
jgi:hypothetical protein